jgi:hypothetical protein
MMPVVIDPSVARQNAFNNLNTGLANATATQQRRAEFYEQKRAQAWQEMMTLAENAAANAQTTYPGITAIDFLKDQDFLTSMEQKAAASGVSLFADPQEKAGFLQRIFGSNNASNSAMEQNRAGLQNLGRTYAGEPGMTMGYQGALSKGTLGAEQTQAPQDTAWLREIMNMRTGQGEQQGGVVTAVPSGAPTPVPAPAPMINPATPAPTEVKKPFTHQEYFTGARDPSERSGPANRAGTATTARRVELEREAEAWAQAELTKKLEEQAPAYTGQSVTGTPSTDAPRSEEAFLSQRAMELFGSQRFMPEVVNRGTQPSYVLSKKNGSTADITDNPRWTAALAQARQEWAANNKNTSLSPNAEELKAQVADLKASWLANNSEYQNLGKPSAAVAATNASIQDTREFISSQATAAGQAVTNYVRGADAAPDPTVELPRGEPYSASVGAQEQPQAAPVDAPPANADPTTWGDAENKAYAGWLYDNQEALNLPPIRNDPRKGTVENAALIVQNNPGRIPQYTRLSQQSAPATTAATTTGQTTGVAAATGTSYTSKAAELGWNDTDIRLVQTYLTGAENLNPSDKRAAVQLLDRAQTVLTRDARQEIQTIGKFTPHPDADLEMIRRYQNMEIMSDPNSPFAKDPRLANLAYTTAGQATQTRQANIEQIQSETDLNRIQAAALLQAGETMQVLSAAQQLASSSSAFNSLNDMVETASKPLLDSYLPRIENAGSEAEASRLRNELQEALASNPEIKSLKTTMTRLLGTFMGGQVSESALKTWQNRSFLGIRLSPKEGETEGTVPYLDYGGGGTANSGLTPEAFLEFYNSAYSQ